MKTKTIRLPDEIIRGIAVVEKEEKIEEATAMRKILRLGFETYVAELYKDGRVTIREAAHLLGKSISETMDIFARRGITGNLQATDVIASMEIFTGRKTGHLKVHR